MACRWLDIETIGFSEVDPYCCKLLTKNFPGVQNYGDIRDLDGSTFTADLITGGFPCQPFSLAGNRKGTEDERHLWPEMFRVIKGCQPAYILAENVPGIVNLALDNCLSDLESIGYETGTMVIPACSVNAPHRRDRVWIIAHSTIPRQPAYPVADANSYHEFRRPGSLQMGRIGVQAKTTLNGNEAGIERPFEPGLGRTNDGLPYRMDGARRGWKEGNWGEGISIIAPKIKNRVDRLRSLGNAIVPQVAYEILRAMLLPVS